MRTNQKRNRLLSIMLTVSMVLSMVPTEALRAYAEELGGTEEAVVTDTMATEEVPAEEVPAEEAAPTEEAPAEEQAVPAEGEAPEEEAPAEEQAATTEEAPAEEAPAEEQAAPAEGAEPAEEQAVPAEEAETSEEAPADDPQATYSADEGASVTAVRVEGGAAAGREAAAEALAQLPELDDEAAESAAEALFPEDGALGTAADDDDYVEPDANASLEEQPDGTFAGEGLASEGGQESVQESTSTDGGVSDDVQAEQTSAETTKAGEAGLQVPAEDPRKTNTSEEELPTDDHNAANDEDNEQEEEQAEARTRTEYAFEDDALRVVATLQHADALPDEAELRVTSVTGSRVNPYMSALDAASDGAVRHDSTNTLLYDISFVGDDGEIEPSTGSVAVRFEFRSAQLTEVIGASDADHVVVTHLPDDDGNVTASNLPAQVDVAGETAEFSTDSFSVYAFSNTTALDDMPMTVASEDDIATGTSGTVTWTIEADGTLVLSPTDGDEGTLDDIGNGNQPWKDYSSQITAVKFEGGTVFTNADASYLFSGLTSLENFDKTNFDTSKAQNFRGLFYRSSKITHLDVGGWDTSGVTDMLGAFQSCTALESVDGLTTWNTSSVTTMSVLFADAANIRSLDLTGWDTSKVTTLYCAFYQCRAIERIDGLGTWNTGSVTDMRGVFRGDWVLDGLDIGSWDVSHVTLANWMFLYDYALTSLDLSSWDLSSLQNGSYMFEYCTALTSIGDVSGWNLPSLQNASAMFYYCSVLERLNFPDDIDTSSLTNMYCMFNRCFALKECNVSGFDTASVTDMRFVFLNCYELETIDVSGWDTSSITSMDELFYGCRAVKELDLSGWYTSNVTNMRGLFNGCGSLRSLNFGDSFDTSKVTNMRYMFATCKSLTRLDLSMWSQTVALTDARSMFTQCSSLEYLDLSKLDITGVTEEFADFFHNVFHVKTVVLGEGFWFKQYSLDPEKYFLTGFLRGVWRRDVDGEDYPATTLVTKYLVEGPMPGTYTKVSDHAIKVDFDVDFSIETASEFEFSTTNDQILCDGRNVYVPIEVQRGDARRDVIELDGSFTAIFRGAVEGADGNTYDLEVTYSNIKIYDPDYPSTQSGTSDLQSYNHIMLTLEDDGTFVVRSDDRYRDTDATIYDDDGDDYITTSWYDITTRVLDTDGNAVDGSFIFSIYDLDLPSRMDAGSEDPGRYPNAPDKLGYGPNAEGVYLRVGFDEDTITVADGTLLYQVDRESGALTGQEQAEGQTPDEGSEDQTPTASLGYRVQGTQTDGSSELTDLVVKAYSSVTPEETFAFTWTGSSCQSFVYFLYSRCVHLDKVNEIGERIAGAQMVLYRVTRDESGSVAREIVRTWTSSALLAQNAYLSPGEYVLAEVSAPEGYEIGEEVTFIVDEDFDVCDLNGRKLLDDNYVTIVDPHVPVEVTVTKRWLDGNDARGKRPAADDFASSLHLVADGVDVQDVTPVVTDNADGTYTATWSDLPMYGEEAAISYTVREDAVDGYEAIGATTVEDGGTLVNALLVDVSVSKQWLDLDGQAAPWPEGASVDVVLTADGQTAGTASLTITEPTHTWEGLRAYGDDGVEVVYAIEESGVEGVADVYATSVAGDAVRGFTVTNTELAEIGITKRWDDGDDEDEVRPTAEEFAAMVHLWAGGTEVTEPEATVTDNGDGTYTVAWGSLPKYDGQGNEIAYEVTEDAPEGYRADADSVLPGETLVNTHKPGKVSVEITKAWSDGDDADGARPSAQDFAYGAHLFANGVEVTGARPTVTDRGDGTYLVSYGFLEKYDAEGVEIAYTVSEDAVAGYEASADGPVAPGSTITNTHAPETTEVSITKSWSDSDDADGVRPTAEEFAAMVHLFADGVEVAGAEAAVTDNGDGTYTVTWSDLPKNAGGRAIAYTASEDAVAGYESSADGPVTPGSTITNTHAPETVEVSGSKTWDDGGDEASRPESITIRLLADGVEVGSRTVTADDGWAWSWTGLPKRSGGEEIAYAVVEDAIEGWATTVSGYDVVNTPAPDTTSVSVSKVWADNGARGGRPASVTVRLTADGAKVGEDVVLDAANGWSHTWSGLAVGPAYAVEEVSVPAGYEASVARDGSHFTVTNKRKPGKPIVPKTGDLPLPLAPLAALGIAAAAGGLALRRRRRRA